MTSLPMPNPLRPISPTPTYRANLYQTILPYVEKTAPRYTSFPPATHFKPIHDSADFESEFESGLKLLPPSEAISLYFHVPFCAQQCWYCGCNQQLARRYAPVEEYLVHLLANLDQLKQRLPKGTLVRHIHFGGGSPNILSPEDLARIMAEIWDHFSPVSDIGEEMEVAIELDPRTTQTRFTRSLGALGFTRASLGVQSFSKDVQEAINRVQPFADVARVVDELRQGGVAHINFDLMYGLPKQTEKMMADDSRKALSLCPDRIAIFGYAHVPWFAKAQRMISEDDLPKAKERARQALAGREIMLGSGYVPLGIDHYALPEDSLTKAYRNGRMGRNFQGYTTDSADWLFGIGPSAISRTPYHYAQNHSATHAWQKSLTEKPSALPIARGIAISPEDNAQGSLIGGLLCFGHAQLPDEIVADRQVMGRLQQFVETGLAHIDGANLRLTPAGQLLGRYIARCLDPLAGPENDRESRLI